MSVRNSENSQLLSDESDAEDQSRRKKSMCSNPFIPVSIVLSVALIVVSALLIFLRAPETQLASNDTISCSKTRNLCESPVCVTVAGQLQSWHDEKIDPCVDFYEHTCGKYREHTLTDGTRLAEKDMIIKGLITDYATRSTKNSTSRSENAVVWVYNKCAELTSVPAGKDVMEEFLKGLHRDIRKIGKWPAAEKDWTLDDFDLNAMLSNMSKLHVLQFGLFEVDASEYPINGTRKQLLIRPAIPRTNVEVDDVMHIQNLFDITTAMLNASGMEFSEARILADLEEYMNLKKRIDAINIKMIFDEPPSFFTLKKTNPSIDFERILRNLPHATKGDWPALRKIIITFNFRLFFDDTQNLETIIRNTKPRILANYLIFKFISQSMDFFVPREKKSLENPCINFLTSHLPRATLRIFVRNYFKKENLKIASEMIEEIKRSFIELFKKTTWLDETTKRNVIRKVEGIRKMVGYTEEYEREGALDRIFGTLFLSPSDSFYTMMGKVNRFRTEQLMDFILSDSMLNPTGVLVKTNAFYFPLKNSLNILVPFLDDPLFDVGFPRYVNMAGVGRVLAHEIGHAFDLMGMHFDWDGQSVQIFTNVTREEHRKRSECLVRQFEAFQDPDYGHQLNGSTVVSELIADGFGNEAAWRTFKTMNLTDEPTLTGFGNYSLDKLYFRIGALDFCAPREHRNYGRDKILTHPTNRFRVNGALANMEAFAKAFSCPVGSPMNPRTKCTFF